METEWGAGLITSWNTGRLDHTVATDRRQDRAADWSRRRRGRRCRLDVAEPLQDPECGDRRLRGSDSQPLSRARPAIVSERTNFPTDLYIADSLARAHGFELVLINADDISAHLEARPAILMLTHVNYRTGRMHRMAEITRAAHDAGAIVIWDLAHSAGAMPVRLHGSGPTDEAADFAIGCGYKYLNGGPGAPAFAWAHPRHIEWMDRHEWRPPLSGWLGHAAPFDFTPDYRPAAGMSRFVCGTPPVLSLAALECGVDTILAAGAMAASLPFETSRSRSPICSSSWSNHVAPDTVSRL